MHDKSGFGGFALRSLGFRGSVQWPLRVSHLLGLLDLTLHFLLHFALDLLRHLPRTPGIIRLPFAVQGLGCRV